MHVVSLHSQKGGTGKTSIALSLALAAYRRGMKPLLVDADLSGTSLRDMIHLKTVSHEQSINAYFRAPTIRNPLEYIATAQLIDVTQNVPREISVILGDTETADLLMPLVYKETHSQFLRTRIERLINDVALDKKIDVIIFDNSPGSWGLGKAILETVTEKTLRNNSAVPIVGVPLLVCSPDLNDIASCLRRRTADTTIQYKHVLNRAVPPAGADIEKNVAQIANNLDAKGNDLGVDGYKVLAQQLRALKFDWIGTDDAELSKVYQSHTRGIKTPTNIADLANLVGWSS